MAVLQTQDSTAASAAEQPSIASAEQSPAADPTAEVMAQIDTLVAQIEKAKGLMEPINEALGKCAVGLQTANKMAEVATTAGKADVAKILVQAIQLAQAEIAKVEGEGEKRAGAVAELQKQLEVVLEKAKTIDLSFDI